MATVQENIALTFDDVHLIPQLSDVESRKLDVDISVRLKNIDVVLPTPFIASPMDTVSGPDMCNAMRSLGGGLAILHRYNTIYEQVGYVKSLVDHPVIGAAIGVNGDFMERAHAVIEAGARLICVDIAHGHHVLMKRALTALRDRWPKIHIMAGNVATLDGFNDLSDWGADSIRLGVGSGSICSTRVQTGHGYPMLQNILDVAKTNRPAQIVSDGGIRSFGDISKAIGAGAHFVMMGSMFAGTRESPGEVIMLEDGRQAKTYRGMASKEAQVEWRGYHSSHEGVSTMIPYKGPLKDVLTDMVNAVKTGLSYSGARSIEQMHRRAKFARVSHASAVEATPHILTAGV
jgi:IMP dehydrogenase